MEDEGHGLRDIFILPSTAYEKEETEIWNWCTRDNTLQNTT